MASTFPLCPFQNSRDRVLESGQAGFPLQLGEEW